MNSLTTLSDGETYADVRFGNDFIVTIDRTARKDALTVRIFHPDAPETPVGEHHLDLTATSEDRDQAIVGTETNAQNNGREGALG